MKKIVETPLMKQYEEMKRKHPDAVLLFRVGDFYETFSDDAVTASEILGITLTRRANGKAAYVELAGFPHHALDTYLPKLVRAGKRVAICEQLEDPKLTKKLVKRGITELVTPGVNLNDNSLRSRENNYLAAVYAGKHAVGAAFLDISTGEFLCTQGTAANIARLIGNIAPKEMLRMHGARQWYDDTIGYKCSIFEMDDWVYTRDAAEERLLKHFDTLSLKGFGLDSKPEAVIAAGSILHYLDLTQHTHISHITTLGRIDDTRYVSLDAFTMRNLELIAPLSPEGKSLLQVLDMCVTPMGSRHLRSWLCFPLVDLDEIRKRQDIVEQFFRDPDMREEVAGALRYVGDMERLVQKVGSRRINARECVQLRDSLRAAERIRQRLLHTDCEAIQQLAAGMSDCSAAADAISNTLTADPPVKIQSGGTIAEGVDAELDELRRLRSHSKEALDDMLRRETEATGISSLKIAYNNVFGYYIEVRNTHKEKVPAEWIRKQTLVNAERYITPELKDYEQKILGAEDRIQQIEQRVYTELCDGLLRFIGDMQRNALGTGTLDTLLSFARSAEEYGYVRPVVDDSLNLEIKAGRHPVIERRLPAGESYVANDVSLSCDSAQIMMITGPNMSGKSAFLRQTALITLMAQTGAFVPADSAHIGFVDKIFTRVGASDNISGGESTFMVEMNEASAILNNMSARSLILFDELGRGTSTYDGISIAWAIVEHIHENGHCRPRTLFATHYHELNEMEKSFPRIVNWNVSVREIDGKVVFLRRLERGGSAHSFGIHVAKLAGMPASIVKRASQVLERLEKGKGKKADVSGIGQGREGYQLSLFQLDDPLLSQVRDALLGIDIDNLTPLQSLQKLHDLQSLLSGK